MAPDLPLSVVIATRNKTDSLWRVLQSLAQQTAKNFEVIVANDGGDPFSENACEMARKLDLHVRHVWVDSPNSTGRGASAARNRAIKLAVGIRTLIIDDDCLCPPNLTGLHASVQESKTGLIGLRKHVSKKWWPENLTHEHIHALDTIPEVREEVRGSYTHLARIASLCRAGAIDTESYCWTCHISYPTLALVSVGGFWEEMRGCGAEDRELAVRLHRYGVKFQFLTDGFVYHLDHEQSEEQKSSYRDNYQLFLKTRRDPRIVVRNGGLLK